MKLLPRDSAYKGVKVCTTFWLRKFKFIKVKFKTAKKAKKFCAKVYKYTGLKAKVSGVYCEIPKACFSKSVIVKVSSKLDAISKKTRARISRRRRKVRAKSREMDGTVEKTRSQTSRRRRKATADIAKSKDPVKEVSLLERFGLPKITQINLKVVREDLKQNIFKIIGRLSMFKKCDPPIELEARGSRWSKCSSIHFKFKTNAQAKKFKKVSNLKGKVDGVYCKVSKNSLYEIRDYEVR